MDWEGLKQIAFGPLNLSHEQFWKLTHGEFLELYEGWKWRENRRVEEEKAKHELEMRRLSVLASWLTAPHLKKPRRPTDFYDPDRKKEKRTTTPEQTRQIIAELSEKMGVK